MYRVIAIVGGGLALAACSSTTDWTDAFKPQPAMDTVRFESTPPGADVKAPNGQTCRTPCALALPSNAPMTVTFSLNGFLPEQADLEPISTGIGPPSLRPNPVEVELSPAPPPKPVKPVRKKRVVKPKPAPKTAAPAPAGATPPMQQSPPPPQQQQPAPWPATPPARQ